MAVDRSGPVASEDRRGRFDRAAPWVVGLGVLALMGATLGDYGMAWDEAFSVEREERLAEWFGRVGGGGGGGPRAWSPSNSNLEGRAEYLARAGAAAKDPWSRPSLRFYWQFAREEPSGHPPFYALLGLAGWTATHRFVPPLVAYRVGPASLFAATVGALFGFLAGRYGRLAAGAGTAGLVAMPRVFAHAHLASYDGPTLCFWLLAIMAFLRAAEAEAKGRRRAWALAFGLAWGLGAATKLTGWFVPIPIVAWGLWHSDRRTPGILAWGTLAAALALYATNPSWWGDPLGGVEQFFRSNLSRGRHARIPTQFLGRVYLFGLPWYNTLAITAMVVPPPTLALALVGVARLALGRFRDRAGTLLLASWAFFLALRALPGAPGHDADRQFLAGFGFLAALAGVGFAGLASALARVAGPRAGRVLAAALLVASATPGAWSTIRYHPLQLSYYSDLVGGLEGATRLGMEPTYYWDALTPDALAWINARTDPGGTIYLAYPIPLFDYLHRWGMLRPSPHPDAGRPPRWYVVQNRPGMLRAYPSLATASWLLRNARPAYARTLPEAPGIPLLAVFEADDALRAAIASRPDAEARVRAASEGRVVPDR